VLVGVLDDVVEPPEFVVPAVGHHLEQHVFVLGRDPQRRESAPQRQVEQIVPAFSACSARAAFTAESRDWRLPVAAWFKFQFQTLSRKARRKITPPRPWLIDGSAGMIVVRWGGRPMAARCCVAPTYDTPSCRSCRPTRLPADPLDRVVAVLAIVGHPVPDSLGVSTAARVLADTT